MMTPEMIEEELAKARTIGTKCTAMFGLEDKLHITFTFNNRFTSRMGDARVRKATIATRSYGEVRLSAPLWPGATLRQREETIHHEVAHVISCYLTNKMDHGPEWRRVMIKLGQRPTRCHDVDTSRVKRRQERFDISCTGCRKVHSISVSMRTKIMTDSRARRCRNCKTQITPEQMIEVVKKPLPVRDPTSTLGLSRKAIAMKKLREMGVITDDNYDTMRKKNTHSLERLVKRYS